MRLGEFVEPTTVADLMERFPYRSDRAEVSLRDYTILAMSLGHRLLADPGFCLGEHGGVMFLGCEYTPSAGEQTV